jgi:hypothetical protein
MISTCIWTITWQSHYYQSITVQLINQCQTAAIHPAILLTKRKLLSNSIICSMQTFRVWSYDWPLLDISCLKTQQHVQPTHICNCCFHSLHFTFSLVYYLSISDIWHRIHQFQSISHNLCLTKHYLLKITYIYTKTTYTNTCQFITSFTQRLKSTAFNITFFSRIKCML